MKCGEKRTKPGVWRILWGDSSQVLRIHLAPMSRPVLVHVWPFTHGFSHFFFFFLESEFQVIRSPAYEREVLVEVVDKSSNKKS